MNEYFIKVVDAPGLAHMVEKEVLVEFSLRARNQCDRFSRCAGFLLYEKYRKYEGGEGSKRIFAKGHVKTDDIVPSDCIVEGKVFPIAMKTTIDKAIPAGQHHHGLSIQEINKICPDLDFRPRPKLGGLYPTNKAQFDALSAELYKRIK